MNLSFRQSFNLRDLGRSHSAWAVLATGVRIGSGVILLPLVLRLLTASELGLWYVFVAIGGMANLLDFGLSPTLARAASCYWAGAAKILPKGVEAHSGTRTPNLAGLHTLIESARALYSFLAALVALAISAFGAYSLYRGEHAFVLTLNIKAAFMLYVAATTLSFYGRLYNVLLTGADGVGRAQEISIISSLAALAVNVVTLLLGGRLIALSLAACAGPLIDQVLSRRALLAHVAMRTVRWRFDATVLRTLLPNTWRVGLVAVGGYLIYNANVLLSQKYLGVLATASLGLSLQFVNILSQISGAVVMVKVPQLVQLRATRSFVELRRCFFSSLLLGSAIYLAGSAVVIFLGATLLHLIHSATSLLPVGMLCLLFGYRFLEFVHVQFAVVTMTDNEVPFVFPAILAGGAIMVIGWFTARQFGMWGMLLTTAIVQLLTNNWYAVWRGMMSLEHRGAGADQWMNGSG